MKKLKDLIYDFNDVFVALLIVVIAAGVIVWRINVVMGYPLRSAQVNTGNEIDINFNDVDLNKEDVDPIVNPDYEYTPITTESAVVEPPVETPVTTEPADEDPVKEPDEKPVTNVKTYTLVISKDNKNTNWAAVSNELKDKGIIKEDDNLGKKATELKLDGSLQLGTFELNSGMSLEDIVKTITKK